MTGEELKIRVRPVEEQRDFLLEQNMLLTGKIATLEKENAELKSGCGMCYRKDKEQLTKAKEIIKNLIVFAEMDDREYEKEYKEAEQFLNSEVEK